jgi:hypothetical protein
MPSPSKVTLGRRSSMPSSSGEKCGAMRRTASMIRASGTRSICAFALACATISMPGGKSALPIVWST